MKISEIDKNFQAKQITKDDEIVYYGLESKNFTLFGVYFEDGVLTRMPKETAKKVSENVFNLRGNTAGGRLKFSTDALCVAIKCEMPVFTIPQMTDTASSGFDMTVKEQGEDGEKIYSKIFQRPYGENKGGYESLVKFDNNNIKDITINFPLYNNVDKLEIGLNGGAEIYPSKGYEYALPIVFYGSSITQGGCASRPSMAYEEILSQKLGFDYINLGFSGNACGEKEMAEYIAGLKMSAFVLDYDHNAKTVEDLENTHWNFYKTVREKNKDLPVIIISRPDFYGKDGDIKRREVIKKTYRLAKRNGENVYFIDGEKIYGNADRQLCSVDGTHPNDLGMYRFARKLYPIIKKILQENKSVVK